VVGKDVGGGQEEVDDEGQAGSEGGLGELPGSTPSLCAPSNARKPQQSVKRVLTSGHKGCTFIPSQKRTGAIPKVEGQQNADGSGVKPELVGVQLCQRFSLER
jgi:hypothetical protein